MTIETEQDLEGIKRIGRIVGLALKEMQQQAEPGMTTRELDEIGQDFLHCHGARSAPQLAYGFPGATCISINEEAAHGIPGARVIQPGDVVNVDVSAELNGYFADTGGTFVIPPVTPEKLRLCHSTKLALSSAIANVRAGSPINAIGKAVQKVARQKGYKIIKNLCGHGVGRSLHEEPKLIPSYFDRADSRRFHEGQVVAVEPFLSTKSDLVAEANDGWTLVCAKGNLSAQYEHTMVITRGRPLLVTAV